MCSLHCIKTTVPGDMVQRMLDMFQSLKRRKLIDRQTAGRRVPALIAQFDDVHRYSRLSQCRRLRLSESSARLGAAGRLLVGPLHNYQLSASMLQSIHTSHHLLLRMTCYHLLQCFVLRFQLGIVHEWDLRAVRSLMASTMADETANEASTAGSHRLRPNR